MVKKAEGIKKGNRTSYGLVNALHGSEEVITKLKKREIEDHIVPARDHRYQWE